MDMTPDEIVVRYRQAKEKGKQLNILAQLNACSVDDIVNILVEHGGYKLDRLSRSRGKAKLLKKEESNKMVENLMRKHVEKAIEKAADKQLEKAKNITPVFTAPEVKDPEPEKIPPVVLRALKAGLDDLKSEIEARRDRIEELEAEIAEFEKDIAALRAWEEEHT
jgi:hypothetical protein